MRTLGENTELMLFDYLEGNYSEDQLMQIEKEINADPLLAEELEIWKSSRIESDFYDTAELESSLIQKTIPSFNFRFYLNAVLVIGIAVFTGTNSKTYEMSAEPITGEVHSISIISPKVNFEEPLLQLDIPIQKPARAPKIALQAEVTDFKKAIYLVPKLADPVFGLTALEINESSVIPQQIIIDPDTNISAKNIRRSQRKDEKDLQKMKSKAEQNQTASEFLKGNVPYVVPVDTENF